MAKMNPWLTAFTLWLLLGLGWAQAQTLGAYEGEVAVASQSDADRVAALPQALAQVLQKLGGSASAAQGVEAAALMQQYRYRQDVVNDAQGARVQHYLIARFDQAAVARLLGTQAAPAWSSERPQPIVWLAIDDGSGARIVSQEAAAAVVPLTARGRQRGLELRLPQYGAAERSTLKAMDLAVEETWAVDQLTSRYGGPALLGWMRRDANGWVADWRLRQSGTELGRWRSQDAQAAVVLAGGADGAADALSQRAQMVFTGPAGRYRVVIEGLHDGAGYAKVMALIARQPIVRGVQTLQADQGRLELDVDLSAGIEGLVQLLRGSVLESIFVGDLETPSEFAVSTP
jgi:hypothetical protein